MKDLRNCDLLIVMGTSLKVYPFASLVNDVPSTTPRLLFNRDEVGPFMGCAVNVDTKEHASTNRSPRDLAWLGECDDGVKKLAQLLSWEL
jgi:NAD+-dependent protein deacetylase sirtuin 2